jgi:hypothetical protein
VTELAGAAFAASVELVVEDEARTDAGTDSDVCKVRHSPPGTAAVFRKNGQVRVVLDNARKTEALLQ